MDRNESTRRLNVLAVFLAALPPERFNYDQWVTNWRRGKQELSCGAQACALGWAATIPEFRAEFTRYPKDRALDWEAGQIKEVLKPGLLLEQGAALGQGYVKYLHTPGLFGYECGVDAGAVAFGLTNYEAEYLFYAQAGEPHRDPKFVAEKILDFIKRRDDPHAPWAPGPEEYEEYEDDRTHDEDGDEDA